jgi:hypothetical protein
MKKSPAVRALEQQLREVNRQIAALTPNGAVCKRCLSTGVRWLYNVRFKGDTFLIDDATSQPHYKTCRNVDAFDVVPE